MARSLFSSVEPLEARIAPAAVIPHIIPGIGKTSTTIDLGVIYDQTVTHGYRTEVDFTTNIDMDLTTPGLQAGVIKILLYDDKAPLTVQNFLNYVSSGDYANTFFHQIVAGAVIQAGAFTEVGTASGAPAPINHINTDVPVSSEANSTDPELQNAMGTIAMAKNSTGPNSATSEFRVNLANNQTPFDAQGYTVFGSILDGMDVINKIAAGTIVDLTAASNNSALGSVPVQGGFTPTAGHPLPAAGQLFEITGATVIAPHGTSDGYTFSVVSVQDHTTHLATDLVSTAITNDALTLTYKTGASGVADVTIESDKDGVTTFQTFSVSVAANLASNDLTSTLNGYIVPGDSGTAKFSIFNNGQRDAHTSLDIKFYATPIINGIPSPGARLLVGELPSHAVDIAAGKSLSISGKVALPDSLFATNGTTYVISAEYASTDPSFTELLSSDNSGSEVVGHQGFNAFGTIPLSSTSEATRNVALTYTDALDHIVTLKMSGKGFGELFPGATDVAPSLQLSGLDFHGVTSGGLAKGSVSLSIKHGIGVTSSTHTDLTNITATDAIGTVKLGLADVHGDVNFLAGVRSLTLGNLSAIGDTSGHLAVQTVAGTPLAKVSPTIKLGAVTDFNLASGIQIAALSFAKWIDSNTATETISAPGITTLSTPGNLEADVTTSGSTAMKLFSVAGALKDSAVQISSDIKSVVLGAMDSSSFSVGTVKTRPDPQVDFTTFHTVSSFVIKGGVAGEAHGLIDSQISAFTFGKISVHDVDGTSGTGPIGFVAGRIESYQHDSLKLGLMIFGQTDVISNYRVQLL